MFNSALQMPISLHWWRGRH